MKKTISALLLVVFLLAACGKKVDAAESNVGRVKQSEIFVQEHRTESGKLCVIATNKYTSNPLAMFCFKD